MHHIANRGGGGNDGGSMELTKEVNVGSGGELEEGGGVEEGHGWGRVKGGEGRGVGNVACLHDRSVEGGS